MTISFIPIKIKYLANSYPTVILIRAIFVNQYVGNVKLAAYAKLSFNIASYVLVWDFSKIFRFII